jgi:hypothetical protein
MKENNFHRSPVGFPEPHPNKPLPNTPHTPIKPDHNPDPTRHKPGKAEPEKNDPTRIPQHPQVDPTRIDDPPLPKQWNYR